MTAEGRLALRPAENEARATIDGEGRVTLRADEPGDWIALEVPEVRVDPLDAGAEFPFADWTLDAVTEASGQALSTQVAAVDPAAALATRPARRLVLVRLERPAAAGELRVLVVRWHQQVPWGSVERLPSLQRLNPVGTPIAYALPRLAGQERPFPYTLAVDVPATAAVVVSGSSDSPLPSGARITVRSHGDAGPDAVVAMGAWRVAEVGGVRVSAPGAGRSDALAVAAVGPPLAVWSGVPLRETDFVQLPASWAPPEGVWGDGVAGIRPWLRFDADTRAGSLRWPGGTPPLLPDLSTVLGAESLAAATWAGHLGGAAEGPVWAEAFARAFALDVLGGTSAAAWRTWLQACARPLAGMTPALSPHLAATTGFRDVAAHCGGPLIVGSMLDDRIGATRARLVRRAIFAAGALDAAAIGAAIVAESPGAAPWVERWVVQGHPVRVDADWSAERTPTGARVVGTLRADSPLAGAPVTLRFVGVGRQYDLVVRGDGVAVPFQADLPFVPRGLRVDPAHRLLQVPGTVATAVATEGEADPGAAS